MQLLPVGLRGRKFLIQFYEIMHEFGGVIPWLDGMDEMRFATDGRWFCEELLRRLGQHDGRITPYQFVETNDARTFIGGILHFDQSPEVLRDHRNAATAERLKSNGASYISCLQVRPSLRNAGVGSKMMERAISAITARHGPIWGVVSDHRLLAWYASLGADLPSPLDNNDRLWIVSWGSDFIKSSTNKVT